MTAIGRAVVQSPTLRVYALGRRNHSRCRGSLDGERLLVEFLPPGAGLEAIQSAYYVKHTRLDILGSKRSGQRIT